MNKKLILFDIDGTLILTRGIAAGLMAECISIVLKRPIQWSMKDFVGNTDRSIINTLLRRNGAIEPSLDDMSEKALEIYLKHLSREINRDGVVNILPGVEMLLAELHRDERFALGLLTGNVREGARIKLTGHRLYDYFPIGAFGNDALKRELLPPFAIQRAEKYYHLFFNRGDIWIVGDSVNDIKCAHANHLHSLAVTTGHQKKEELQEYRPTVLIPDLSDVQKVMDIFLSS
ncbi:MAG: HAD family hydrolase [Calditrichia bacterium]